MQQRKLAAMVLAPVLICVLQAGCGNQKMVDPAESVDVSGTVTLNGKPLNYAEIIFISADGDSSVGPVLATSNKKGEYSASLNAPREYKVSIDRMLNGAPNPALKAYQGEGTSLKANVTKENRTFNFDLKTGN